jgi:hypothetical protein
VNFYGTYDRSTGKIPIREQDLHYENTNGLNYISIQLNNTTPRYETRNQKFAIHQRLGLGVGPVVTQTDFFWNGNQYHSKFGLTGYGISAHTGVRFDFFNRFFLQVQLVRRIYSPPPISNQAYQLVGNNFRDTFLIINDDKLVRLQEGKMQDGRQYSWYAKQVESYWFFNVTNMVSLLLSNQ